MTDALLFALSVAGALMILPMFWGVVIWLVGIGWRRIAADYPAREWPEEGQDATWQNLDLGISNYYGSGLIFRVTDEGLYARAHWLYRLGHPPLFIPWDEIEEVGVGTLGGREIRTRAGHTLSVADELAAAIGRASAAQASGEAEPPEAFRDEPLAPEEAQGIPKQRKTGSR